MRISFADATKVLIDKLEKHGCPKDRASLVGYEMVRNSLEGTYTHGINRFARLIRNIDEKIVLPNEDIKLLASFNAMESYDGCLGLGIVNATFAMNRAIELASRYGIAVIAVRNTNHWLRAATYGYQACDRGYAAICFTNTIPNMPTWGACDSRIGNNPLMMAFPKKDGMHIVVDSAMSQFSYGSLELARLEGRLMPFDAGFDKDGNLTKDPDKVIKSRRIIPAGYWKGAALSFILDILASSLSDGNSVAKIGKLPGDEHGVSQIFIAIDYTKLISEENADAIVGFAISDLKESIKAEGTKEIIYPGERLHKIREENLKNGIPVDSGIWEEILKL